MEENCRCALLSEVVEALPNVLLHIELLFEGLESMLNAQRDAIWQQQKHSTIFKYTALSRGDKDVYRIGRPIS